MKIVAIAAYSGVPPQELVEKANAFIEELAKCNPKPILALGGYWGLMKNIVDKALSLRFTVLIFPPIEREDWEYPEKTIVIKSGVSFRLRSVMLVRTGDVLVAMGGGAGTMQEIVTAYTEGRDVYMLYPTSLPSDRITSMTPHLDNRATATIKVYKDPREMAKEVCKAIRGCFEEK